MLEVHLNSIQRDDKFARISAIIYDATDISEDEREYKYIKTIEGILSLEYTNEEIQEILSSNVGEL